MTNGGDVGGEGGRRGGYGGTFCLMNNWKDCASSDINPFPKQFQKNVHRDCRASNSKNSQMPREKNVLHRSQQVCTSILVISALAEQLVAFELFLFEIVSNKLQRGGGGAAGGAGGDGG